jgi:hypothetical protein
VSIKKSLIKHVLWNLVESVKDLTDFEKIKTEELNPVDLFVFQSQQERRRLFDKLKQNKQKIRCKIR